MTVSPRMTSDPSAFDAALRAAFDAALTAGDPRQITNAACGALGKVPTAIVAVGKAAGAMAEAARDAGCSAPGIVVTTDENHRYIAGFRCFAASHPVPDQRGLAAAEAVEALVTSLGEGDHLLLLISGGGSALLPAPAPGISLAQKMALNDALLASGLDIHAMNVVRRLFSRLKGGRLARLAAPATVTQFLLSDVPGDLPESIASGPAVADPVPLVAAVKLIEDARLDRLDFVKSHLEAIRAGHRDEPVRPGAPLLDAVTTRILASNAKCRDAAAADLGRHMPQFDALAPPMLGGEAADMAKQLSDRICRHCREKTDDGVFGLVAGGETTVTLNPAKAGLGGRSQELALAFAVAMHAADDAPGAWAILAGGTDGRDGPTDAAGGVVLSSQAFDRTAAMAALRDHNSYPHLKACGQLLTVGATGTNLADLVLILARR
jgi:glycerate 2-kinase